MKTYILIIAALLVSTTSFSQVTLDSTFGNNGIVRTNISPDNLVINSLAFQSDSNIVAAGYTFNYQFKIIRHLPNGLLDTSFGINGITTIPNQGIPTDVLIQDDGKIIVAGFTNAPSKNIIARFLPNGNLDSSFGGNGIVQITIPSSTDDGISEIAIQPDGKIVAGGWANAAVNQFLFLVMRFLDNGTLDTSFGQGGLVKTSLQTSSSISSIALQNDGKIVASGGTSTGNPSSNFALVRYNTDGSLDNTFGTAGKVITDVYSFGDGDDGANSLKLQPDNKILVAGTAGGKCALARYNINGSLDNSFGINGIVIDNSILSIVDIALQSDEKILAIATGNPTTLTRFNINGSKDINFANFGTFTVSLVNLSENAEYINITPESKIIIAGSAKETTTPVEGLLIRFNNDINTNINKNIKRNNLLSIYPNPVKNNLIIVPQAIISGKIKIELFDVLGRVVLSENRILGNEPLTLNVASVRNGSYVLHITFADGSKEVAKLVVSR